MERGDSPHHEDEILIVPTSRSSTRSAAKGFTPRDEDEDVVLSASGSLQVQSKFSCSSS
jgi:hypothetical protein